MGWTLLVMQRNHSPCFLIAEIQRLDISRYLPFACDVGDSIAKSLDDDVLEGDPPRKGVDDP